jgi:tRNA-dihydrouridine synthase A
LSGFARAAAAAGCRTLIVHARKAWLSGLSPKENREVPPLDYPRVHRLKGDFPSIEIVLNGGLTDAAAVRAQLAHVDGVMIGRSAYHEPMLMADLETATGHGPDTGGTSFFVGAASGRDLEEIATGRRSYKRRRVLSEYCRYIETELDAGTPLKAMTRHLMGMYANERGGRRWRRELGLLADGSHGLAALRALISSQSEGDCNDSEELATITRAIAIPPVEVVP